MSLSAIAQQEPDFHGPMAPQEEDLRHRLLGTLTNNDPDDITNGIAPLPGIPSGPPANNTWLFYRATTTKE
jgi:hypothetical protein